MKILMLNHNVAERGGTYYRAFHAGRYLVRRGHQVTLLTVSARRRFRFDRVMREGVEVMESPDLFWGTGRTGWDVWDAVRRSLWARNRGWDVVHAWDCRPAVIIPALSLHRQTSGRPHLIIDWCDWWGRGGTQAERPDSMLKRAYAPIETFFEEHFRARADATTVASEALRQRVIGLGVHPDTVMLLPGGCDTEAIRPQDRHAPRASLGIRDAFVVGYMGAMPASEVALVAETLQAVRRQIPSVTFLAIGVSIAGSRVPFRELIGADAASFTVETGRVPFEQVGRYLAACDVLMLAMRDNIANAARWPSKINDYLAAGRPIVATRVGEVGRLFDERIGAIVAPEAQQIAKAIVELLRDPDRAAEAGRYARSVAEDDLNWSRLAMRLERHYANSATTEGDMS
jgi:glycosyltransferase involved in cell wall biosynthesis